MLKQKQYSMEVHFTVVLVGLSMTPSLYNLPREDAVLIFCHGKMPGFSQKTFSHLNCSVQRKTDVLLLFILNI